MLCVECTKLLCILQHPSWPHREFLDGGHAEGEETWPEKQPGKKRGKAKILKHGFTSVVAPALFPLLPTRVEVMPHQLWTTHKRVVIVQAPESHLLLPTPNQAALHSAGTGLCWAGVARKDNGNDMYKRQNLEETQQKRGSIQEGALALERWFSS